MENLLTMARTRVNIHFKLVRDFKIFLCFSGSSRLQGPSLFLSNTYLAYLFFLFLFVLFSFVFEVGLPAVIINNVFDFLLKNLNYESLFLRHVSYEEFKHLLLVLCFVSAFYFHQSCFLDTSDQNYRHNRHQDLKAHQKTSKAS